MTSVGDWILGDSPVVVRRCDSLKFMTFGLPLDIGCLVPWWWGWSINRTFNAYSSLHALCILARTQLIPGDFVYSSRYAAATRLRQTLEITSLSPCY